VANNALKLYEYREYKPEEEARDVKNSTPFASSWEKEVILNINKIYI
jgi:hypothetical protein